MINARLMIANKHKGLGGILDFDTALAELRWLDRLDGVGLGACGDAAEVFIGQIPDVIRIDVTDYGNRQIAGAIVLFEKCFSFGARHVHPSVSGILDYSAIVGGCVGCSSAAGANLTGVEPSGTMPHSLIIVMGDTVKATVAFDKYMPSEVPRISLVDTFKDEAEESLRVAEALGERLNSVRLDTPGERGGVTVDLVKEVRVRLDLAGYNKVQIFVTGGLDPERITYFLDNGAPVDGFGVGSYISSARPIDFTADLHELEGKPIAKRGRIPGITPNPRLKRVM